MEKKRCLFCNQFVMVKTEGDHDRFIGCYCSPYGEYGLYKSSHEPFNQLSYQKKNQMFPVISAHIREVTDQGGMVNMSFSDMEDIWNSPRRPVTIEEKGFRLLQYLHRHSDAPGEPITVSIAESYNLTYSPNLQELVYIIEKLKDEEYLIREGTVLKLTEKGWKEGADRAGEEERRNKCFILHSMGNDEEQQHVWMEQILPIMEECGYKPYLSDITAAESELEKQSDHMAKHITDSKLLIVEGRLPEIFFAAGCAVGLKIPVIWAVHRSETEGMVVQSEQIHYLIWDQIEELAGMLQQIMG